MAIKQVSERIIKQNFICLDNVYKSSISHSESELYLDNDIVYKILKKDFRFDRYLYCYLLTLKHYSNSVNIIDELYQGDKFIGITTKYIKNYESLSKSMFKLDLYEAKIIMENIINFYNETLKDDFLYWDNHLNNMGLSNNELYIMDIDSMKYKPSKVDINYALNGLLALFYEIIFKEHIRNNFDNYRDIIFRISGSINYLNYNLDLDEIKLLVSNTTQTTIDEKIKLLKKV